MAKKPVEVPAKVVRLITFTFSSKKGKILGTVLHLGYGCMVLDGKESVDVTAMAEPGGLFHGFPICRICRHMKLGDYQKFPAVTIRPHILLELEKQYGNKENQNGES